VEKQYYEELSCKQCMDAPSLGFDFSFAFQPIVRASTRAITAYEALARGTGGEPFLEVWRNVNQSNLYRFDQACRVKAIRLATQLRLDCGLNVNFTPNAVYKPELCIRTTMEAAQEFGFPIENINLEVTEGEEVSDKQHLVNIIEAYRKLGFATLIDDFGAGYSGLNLLAAFQPDCIKIDRGLISDIHENPPKQAIVAGITLTCSKLGIEVLAEGVEQQQEYQWLRDSGIDLFQGYYFARPGFEQLPEVAKGLF